MAAGSMDYPVQLGLAYLFFVGYLVRSLFLSVKLPGAVGVILSGFAFSYFMQPEILSARDNLQALAFFLVLLIAGLEISLRDLRPYILVMAVLPAAFELSAIAAFSRHLLGYTWIEAAVLGTVLFCIGDGLVIPKMNEFRDTAEFASHPLPRLVFMCAPLEASFALTVFGVLVGLAEPAHQPPKPVVVMAFATLLRIVATLVVGAFLGSATGWLIPKRTKLVSISGQPIFTGATVEAFLMMFAMALAAFSLGAAEGGRPLVPMGFCGGSVFQSELLVIVAGTFFAATADAELVEGVQGAMGGVWVFGQLILFGMLGSRTEPGVFGVFPAVLPIMVVGLLARFLGVFLAFVITIPCRPCSCATCRSANWASLWPDTIFFFVSTLPRASIQGALGSIPSTQRFFQSDGRRNDIQLFIASSARLYIIFMAVIGSIVLDLVGPIMLRAWDDQRRDRGKCLSGIDQEEERRNVIGWTFSERMLSLDGQKDVTNYTARPDFVTMREQFVESPATARRVASTAAGQLTTPEIEQDDIGSRWNWPKERSKNFSIGSERKQLFGDDAASLARVGARGDEASVFDTLSSFNSLQSPSSRTTARNLRPLHMFEAAGTSPQVLNLEDAWSTRTASRTASRSSRPTTSPLESGNINEDHAVTHPILEGGEDEP